MQLPLFPHPHSAPTEPFKLWASVEKTAGFGAMATLNLWFGIEAPASRFHIPVMPGGGRADNLWRTTCFEAFLQRPGELAYREWNFAPSGKWAAYDFADYREGMEQAGIDPPPYIRMEDNLTWWTLGATIAVETDQAWRLGLSAVIEEREGRISHWALAHPDPQKPDFHLADCFTAKLA